MPVQVLAWSGLAWHGTAWQDRTRQGMARHGMACDNAGDDITKRSTHLSQPTAGVGCFAAASRQAAGLPGRPARCYAGSYLG